MKKDESIFVRTGDTPSRESIYNFFSGTTFHVKKPPRIEAKVSMQIDQHNPDFFQDIIVEIQIRTIDAEWDQNVAIASLDLLLTCTSEDVLPWIDSYLMEGRKPGDKAFGEEMMKIGTVIEAYAEAFAGLVPESPDVAEAREREEVRKFLTGEVQHHLGNFELSILMLLHDYGSDGFKDNPASIGVKRTDGSFSGHILTKVEGIYSFDINTRLDALPITAIEAGAIANYIRYQLHRFETLGPMPVTNTGCFVQRR